MNRARELLPPVLLALASVLLVVILMQYALAAAEPRPISQPARTIPHTDVNPFGANFFLHEEVEEWKREKTVRMAQQAGIAYAKQQFPWADIEPLAKGEYYTPGSRTNSWDKYDQIVSLFERYGMHIIARLDRAPEWARPEGSLREQPPSRFEDFGDYVYTFVDHYRGRIHYIQIWNEPNIFPEWGDQAVDPAAYTEMLKIAYQRAKEADPDIVVLSAPLAITTEDFPERRNLSDLIFLEEMYQAGAGDYFDILSANAFGMDQPPDAPPSPDTLNFSRVLLQREIMEKYGDAEKAVWFNEYGWNAAPADFPEDHLTWKRVSEEQQAAFTVQGIHLARQEWPWAGVFNIWYFRQVGHILPTDAAYYFRMVDVDFTPRPLYYAVQSAADELSVAAPGMIEETNPAVTWNYGWQPASDDQASARRFATANTPGSNMTIRFRGEGIDLITRTGPQDGQLLVRVDGGPVATLPRNADGQSFIDLHQPEVAWQQSIELARGLSLAEHTLELTMNSYQASVSGPTTCTVDGFRITVRDGPDFPALQAVVLGSLTVLMGIVTINDRRNRARPAP